jgi:hypothetical protein
MLFFRKPKKVGVMSISAGKLSYRNNASRRPFDAYVGASIGSPMSSNAYSLERIDLINTAPLLFTTGGNIDLFFGHRPAMLNKYVIRSRISSEEISGDFEVFLP